MQVMHIIRFTNFISIYYYNKIIEVNTLDIYLHDIKIHCITIRIIFEMRIIDY